VLSTTGMLMQPSEAIYRGSHGKSCLGTACKTWTSSAIRVTLDEPGSQPALAVGQVAHENLLTRLINYSRRTLQIIFSEQISRGKITLI
jgi:hypothetical protein